MIQSISKLNRRLTAAVLASCFTAISPWTPEAAAQHAPPVDFSDLSAKLLPTVVNVTVRTKSANSADASSGIPGSQKSPFDDFFRDFQRRHGGQGGQTDPQQQRRGVAVGSGFVIDAEKGYIVTDNHVIEGGDDIMVTFANGKRAKAVVIGRDPAPAGIDIAVLKITPTPDLVSAHWGDSDAARVGEWVLAIGNPYNFANTVSAGIISARNREMGGHYDDFIQTDAAINQGNSGGPLFNMKGDVIGINTLIYSPQGVSIGLGFATSSSEARPIVAQLIQYGAVKRGWLGVSIQAIDSDIADGLGLKAVSGALVGSVLPKGPAAVAGIQAEDVILTFDGKEVPDSRRLPRLVAETSVDREVDVKVWRDGKEILKRVKVAPLPDGDQVASATDKGAKPGDPTSKGAEPAADQLGLGLAPLTPEVRQQYRLGNDVAGVLVTDVKPNSPAADKQIAVGDILIEVSQQGVKSPKDVAQKIDDSRKGSKKSILLLVQTQNGETKFVALPVEKKG